MGNLENLLLRQGQCLLFKSNALRIAACAHLQRVQSFLTAGLYQTQFVSIGLNLSCPNTLDVS